MTVHGHNRPSGAQAAAVAIIVAVVVGPMAGLAGVVLTGSARQEGAISVGAGVIQAGKASVKWPDVRVAVNDSADRAAAEPDALHLANGEVWTGKIAKAGGGRVTLVSALLGSRVVKTAELRAIDFVPGLPAPTAAKTGRLYRVKGRPVDGELVWIEADRVAVDTALGAVAMDRKILKRYVFASKPQQPAPPTGDEMTLTDGSILFGQVEPTAKGLLLTHAVLGRKLIGPKMWRSVRRHSAAVTYLADVKPHSVKTFPLIRRPADPPHVERDRDGAVGAFVRRMHVHPKTVVVWRLDAEAGTKRVFRATVGLSADSRGAVRVRFLLGGKGVFDQVLTPKARGPVDVTFSVGAATDLTLDVDFDKSVQFPCRAVIDDPYVLKT